MSEIKFPIRSSVYTKLQYTNPEEFSEEDS